MEQMKIAKYLKIFSIITAFIGGLFFFILYLGILQMFEYYPELLNLKETAILCLIVIEVFCYMALYQFWKICTQIGLGNSFTHQNAISMKKIGWFASFVLLIILCGTFFLGVIGYLSAPFVVLVFFLTFVTCGIIVICFALSKLIENAAQIKEENDLTI